MLFRQAEHGPEAVAAWELGVVPVFGHGLALDMLG